MGAPTHPVGTRPPQLIGGVDGKRVPPLVTNTSYEGLGPGRLLSLVVCSLYSAMDSIAASRTILHRVEPFHLGDAKVWALLSNLERRGS